MKKLIMLIVILNISIKAQSQCQIEINSSNLVFEDYDNNGQIDAVTISGKSIDCDSLFISINCREFGNDDVCTRNLKSGTAIPTIGGSWEITLEEFSCCCIGEQEIEINARCLTGSCASKIRADYPCGDECGIIGLTIEKDSCLPGDSESVEVELSATTEGNVELIIFDWGDNSSPEIIASPEASISKSHVYDCPQYGPYKVKISALCDNADELVTVFFDETPNKDEDGDSDNNNDGLFFNICECPLNTDQDISVTNDGCNFSFSINEPECKKFSSLLWDFGDESGDKEFLKGDDEAYNPNHEYQENGTYTVRVTVLGVNNLEECYIVKTITVNCQDVDSVTTEECGWQFWRCISIWCAIVLAIFLIVLTTELILIGEGVKKKGLQSGSTPVDPITQGVAVDPTTFVRNVISDVRVIFGSIGLSLSAYAIIHCPCAWAATALAAVVLAVTYFLIKRSCPGLINLLIAIGAILAAIAIVNNSYNCI